MTDIIDNIDNLFKLYGTVVTFGFFIGWFVGFVKSSL